MALTDELDALRAERDFATALVETTQTLVCVFDRDGRIVRFNRACEEATGYPAAEVLGRAARELVIPPEEREAFDRMLAEVRASGEPSPQLGHWLRRDGGRRTIAWANRPLLDGDRRVTHLVSTGLDVTERERATAELVRLADEQAALRRVATLVASDPEAEDVFGSVAEEAGRLLGARAAATIRFDDDLATIVGRWRGSPGSGDRGGFEVGTAVPLANAGLTGTIAVTGRPARLDGYSGVAGTGPEMMHELGYTSAVAAPIIVGGRTWGVLFVASADPDALPDGAESRLDDFAELVALALASAEARAELRASRARIVEAGVAERRRLERNLHDGAQQRLVTLALTLRLLQARVRDDPPAAEPLVVSAAEELRLALEELRELARGLHPAILADRGLGPALESLAARAPFPVTIEGVPARRLTPALEAAAYYVVAEGLTNAAKYADASSAVVHLRVDERSLCVELRDNGRGGAEASAGTGLRGLADRVEALGGRLVLESPPGEGTTLRAELPL